MGNNIYDVDLEIYQAFAAANFRGLIANNGAANMKQFRYGYYGTDTHMTILRQAGLVRARKEGRWMYYNLPRREMSGPVKQALVFVRTHLVQAKQIQLDNTKLKKILQMDKEILCKRQMRK